MKTTQDPSFQSYLDTLPGKDQTLYRQLDETDRMLTMIYYRLMLRLWSDYGVKSSLPLSDGIVDDPFPRYFPRLQITTAGQPITFHFHAFDGGSYTCNCHNENFQLDDPKFFDKLTDHVYDHVENGI